MIRPFERSAILIAILLLGLMLRLAPWGQNRFLEDEALYAYWGLQIATGADPMLDEEPVDKPPLHPYMLALSFLLFGQSETAARLPSLFASVASIALIYALGRSLYADDRVGFGAALLLALSPFDILFASTAFTDPLMVAFVLGALLASAKGKLGLAGVLSGLAAAIKQQGLFFLPLVVGVGLLGMAVLRQPQDDNRRDWRIWARFVLGFGLIVGGVIWWDLARVQRPGFFEQSLISYGGVGPAQPGSLGSRAIAWLRLVGGFWVSPWFNSLLIGALAVWILAGKLGNWEIGAVDQVLGLFVIGFLLLHWLVGFQIWDRYLLGLVPLAALLTARAFFCLRDAIQSSTWQRAYTLGLGVLLVGLLAGPLLRTTRSELAIGGDHGAYDGIDEVAAYMRTQAPTGSVLYHYWLGYHHRYYLHGAPLRLHWYPDLEDLSHDAYVYRREPRYIAFPSWRDGSAAEATLADAGIHLIPAFETTRRDGTVSFRLYRLEGP